ncbi:MAG: hypothetical protein SVR04_13045 [Spirochaetota bacterium]|nr:hypothetical protein [Spirochaetota bacterium]
MKKIAMGAVCLVLTAGSLVGQDYREEMRQFVCSISNYARAENPSFLIIPQNGQEILPDFPSRSKNL